jgi:CHAT domain-containing protein
MVNLVTLAACRTGQQSSLPGTESTGMVRSLMEMGARNVLAGQCAVHNDATAEWMYNFYNDILSGTSIPSAVRKTSINMQNKYRSAYHWGSFVLYGVG